MKRKIEKALNNEYIIREREGKYELEEIDVDNFDYMRKPVIRKFDSLQAIIEKFNLRDYLEHMERVEKNRRK